MPFRKVIFWIHLIAGVLVGVPVVIMSATGIAIAFEAEILDYIDRDQLAVQVPSGGSRKPLAELTAGALRQHPEFTPTLFVVPRDARSAYVFRAGREGLLYVDPYTGVASVPQSTGAHDVLHELESWHRTLGLEGERQAAGKLLNGVANLALLLLCVTGLYLWFPRKWTKTALRPVLVFVRTKGSKARDFNWHHVFGFWGLPVLSVVVASAVVFSFEWAHRLVFTLAGEEAPAARGPGMLSVPTVGVPVPSEGMTLLTHDQVLARVAPLFPDHEAILFEAHAPAPESVDGTATHAAVAPMPVVVMIPDIFSTHGRVPLQVDPYRGTVLSTTRFADYSPGIQARVWLRFLHTGDVFGMVGKSIATLATFGSLVLVYTGIALTFRRFVAWRRRTKLRLVKSTLTRDGT